MRKRVVHLVTGLTAAGMFAATGFVGTQTIVRVTSAETTETVEFAMEENASYSSRMSKKEVGDFGLTQFNNFQQVKESMGSKYSAFKIHSIGYNGEVLLLYSGKNMARFYTQKAGEKVRFIGALRTPHQEPDTFFYKDGVIYNHSSVNGESVYETYAVSSDGKELVHKDYARRRIYEGMTDYYSYTNKTNDENRRTKGSDKEDAYFAVMHEYDRAYKGASLQKYSFE